MDLQKIATYGSAAAVIGTGTVIGGNQAIDNYTGGPQKRADAEEVRLRRIIAEEVYKQLAGAWPTTSGPVKGLRPPQDYKKQVPPPNGSTK
tara:strand:+ start:1008 stop:1280 length:273 start_codon:yes stop_codon:yes gene_type:complete